MRVLVTDLLVMGGGAAGCNVALRAHELGIGVLMVVKGILGKSGCSIFAGNLNVGNLELRTVAPIDHGNAENPHQWMEGLVKYASHYLVDQDYIRQSNEWIRDNYVPRLEADGLYVRRDDAGRVVTSVGHHQKIAGANQQGQSGTTIMKQHRKEVFRRGIPVLEETAVTSFLTNAAGAVVGATALNILTGEFCAIRAKAVVVCTGQADRMASRATGTRDQAADGIALAYRVGAEMQNLEIQWWHNSDVAYPRSWMRLHIYPNPLMGTTETIRMYNNQGEMFFEQKQNPGNHMPYTQQNRMLYHQVQAGKAGWDGGYFAGYDHIDPLIIKAYNHQSKAWERLGLDVAEHRLECGITWHMRQGGIHLNPATMTTSVPGLFAAGSVGGHFLGSIRHVTYDGILAAEQAAAWVQRAELPALPMAQAEAEEARVLGLLRPVPSEGWPAVQVKNRLRHVMWEHMGYVKSGSSMQTALAEIADIRARMLPRMGLKNTTRRYNYGWIEALDVLNMLDVCEITVHSAMRRTESRGPFFREDFPQVDNVNWIAKNILRRGETGPQFRTEPYDLKYLRPPADRVEFFSTNY